MLKVHIVIPVYNGWEMTHELLWNLYKHEKENISKVTIIDNCSTSPECLGGMRWWKENGMLPFDFAVNETNLGFLKSANAGLRIAVGESEPDDIIVLLSNDVKVLGKFIQPIKDILKDNPKSLIGGILYTQDTGWNRFGDKIFPYIEGWILATTAHSWKSLNYFDERYAPNDFEDVDLSTFAKTLDFSLVPLNNPALVHLGGRTINYNEKRAEQTKISQKKFGEKWIK